MGWGPYEIFRLAGPSEGRDQLSYRFIGQGSHFLVGTVLNRVAYEHPGDIETEGPRLDFGRVGERRGSHHD